MIWRPKVKNVYMDTKLKLERNDILYWLSETHMRVVIKDNPKLPPIYDIIKYEHQNHKQDFYNNIPWIYSPNQSIPLIIKLVQ